MVPFKFPITLPYIIRLFGVLQIYLYREVVFTAPSKPVFLWVIQVQCVLVCCSEQYCGSYKAKPLSWFKSAARNWILSLCLVQADLCASIPLRSKSCVTLKFRQTSNYWGNGRKVSSAYFIGTLWVNEGIILKVTLNEGMFWARLLNESALGFRASFIGERLNKILSLNLAEMRKNFLKIFRKKYFFSIV